MRNSHPMSATERRAVINLSAIMGLRMVGLFMVLPVFSLYATHLHGATPALIGLAMGIYGLAQALFQIPFGSLSDRFGRKPIILLGLSIFCVGSVVAGFAHSITLMIIGRSLQGIGAVGSTILALMADLTREEQRTKAMAIAGITIGFSFSIAMLIGPVLTQWLSINALFFLAAFLGIIAMLVLTARVPTPQHSHWHRDTEPELSAFVRLLFDSHLAKLNIGIFILHAIFTASFIVIPIGIDHYAHLSASRQWLLYLPTLLVAFILSLFCIGVAERKQQLKPFFISSIALLAGSECLLWLNPSNLSLTVLGLCLFFGGFSILEAFMPSLISRTAPATRKGSALGIYSCSQFLGIFTGGAFGGWLYGQFSFTGVYLFCITLALIWLGLAILMKPPRYLVTQMWKLQPSQRPQWERLSTHLRVIPGIVEVVFIAEEDIAYLKMERQTARDPNFIRIKMQIVGDAE